MANGNVITFQESQILKNFALIQNLVPRSQSVVYVTRIQFKILKKTEQ